MTARDEVNGWQRGSKCITVIKFKAQAPDGRRTGAGREQDGSQMGAGRAQFGRRGRGSPVWSLSGTL